MRRAARVTSKGQVTIPQEIRRTLGVEEGDTVIFEVDEHGVVHLRPNHPLGVFAQQQGILREGQGKTRAEIIAEIRELRGDLP